jgi:hypothetical protein
MSENNEKLKYIGVKDLGNLAKEDFCPRCFWYERKFGPFPAIFPGVFNVIDKNLKNITWLKWKKEKTLPVWLEIKNVDSILTAASISEVEERYRQKYLILNHIESGFILRGAPDLILKLKDDTLHLIDFKTARYKEDDRQYFPVYEAQLNGYALLATKMPVSKLSLVYFNPTNEIPEEAYIEEKFKLNFEPKITPIEIKEGLIHKLLMLAAEILSLDKPPKAREGCRNTCYYIEKVKLNN